MSVTSHNVNDCRIGIQGNLSTVCAIFVALKEIQNYFKTTTLKKTRKEIVKSMNLQQTRIFHAAECVFLHRFPECPF